MRRFYALLLMTSLAVTTSAFVACGGGSSEPAPVDVTPSTELKLVAKNSKFDKKSLATIPMADVVLILDNRDAGTLHNFAVYRTSDGKGKVFGGDLFAGRKSVEYRFRSPEQGVYYFRCDAHPEMKGTFTVKPASN
jgi:plastocyanin